MTIIHRESGKIKTFIMVWMKFRFIMTKNVALKDIEGTLCHFNLAFEKDWEVAEELNNRTKTRI